MKAQRQFKKLRTNRKEKTMRNRNSIMKIAATVALFIALSAASTFGCTSTARPKVYYNPPRSEWSSLPGTLCDFDSRFNCTDIKLRGSLYLPAGETVASSKKDMPLIIYNHGSGRAAPDVCEMASYFNNHGYLFFVPFRRGTAGSTGVYFQDYLDRIVCPSGLCDATTSHLVLLDYLDHHAASR